MSYKVYKSNGEFLVELPDGQLDETTLTLGLIGKNSTNYGTLLNTNFIKLLENSAQPQPGPAFGSQSNLLKGQLWFDTTVNKLKVWDGNDWKSTGSPIVQASQPLPSAVATGDIWIDTTNNQLHFYDGTDFVLAGPVYKESQGLTGFDVVDVSTNTGQNVTVADFYVAGVKLGFFANDDFLLSDSSQAYAGFNSTIPGELYFDVRARAANFLLRGDSSEVNANDLLDVTAVTNTLQGQLIIENDAPLVLGDENNFEFAFVNGTTKLVNIIPDRDLAFEINDGGTLKTVLYVDGSEARIGIGHKALGWNVNPPAYTLDVNGDMRVTGNFIVDGTSTTINSTTLTVDDLNVVVASGASNAAAADGAGLTVDTNNTVSGSNPQFYWWNANQSFHSTVNLSVPATGQIRLAGDLAIGWDGTFSTISLGANVTRAPGVTKLGTLTDLTVDDISINNDTIASVGNIVFAVPSGSYIDASDVHVKNVLDPIDPSDAATKFYVDQAVTIGTAGQGGSLSLVSDGSLTNNQIAGILQTVIPATGKAAGTEARVHVQVLSIVGVAINITRSTKLYSVDTGSNWVYEYDIP